MKKLIMTFLLVTALMLLQSWTTADASEKNHIHAVMIVDVSSSMRGESENVRLNLMQVVYSLLPEDELTILTADNKQLRDWYNKSLSGKYGERERILSFISKIRLEAHSSGVLVALEDAERIFQSKTIKQQVLVAILTDGKLSKDEISRIRFFSGIWKSHGYTVWVTGSRKSHRDLLAAANEGLFKFAPLNRLLLEQEIRQLRAPSTEESPARNQVPIEIPGPSDSADKAVPQDQNASSLQPVKVSDINTAAPPASDESNIKMEEEKQPKKTPRTKRKPVIKLKNLIIALVLAVVSVVAIFLIRDAVVSSRGLAEEGLDQELVDQSDNLIISCNGQAWDMGLAKHSKKISVGNLPANDVCIEGDGIEPVHLLIKHSGRSCTVKNLSSNLINVAGDELAPRKSLRLNLPAQIIVADGIAMDVGLVPEGLAPGNEVHEKI